ncbi:ABC transporter permease [Algoriphagus terrigena]|uniref:ABC transporter permease n=1 Tax=Algoriphagus terrigena TaxID=344884 RepID=UPI00041B6233|nr:ABC transporter permease [Algoriphagus terrigena]
MHPPKKALSFLRWFCRQEYVEEIEGDLTEIFYKEHSQSSAKARYKFTWRVLKYLRPEYIKSFNFSPQSSGMYRNYLTLAWRNIRQNKSFSSLNIIGLSIGMTCCLIIFQYVTLESSFDRFHDKKQDLFRVLQAFASGGEQMETGHAYTAQALAPTLENEVPEIVNIARVHQENALVSAIQSPEQVFEEDRALYVDAAFMEMFSFPLISGDAKLSPGTVLLSEATANKYFGNQQAEGQTLQVTGETDKTYTVAGIFKEVPTNSHLQFDMLLPMEDLLRGTGYETEPEGGWSWNNFTTYLELHPTADREEVKRKMTEVFAKHRADMLKQQGRTVAVTLQPLDDIHLNSDITGAGSIVAGSYKTLYFFLVIGIITLVIALVNYINLATARALNRSQEVGVRKAIGARRNQLITQFLYESALTNVTAMAIALLLTLILLPFVNDIAETQLSVAQWLDPMFLLALAVTLIAGTLLAGLYPAFVLSSFRPAVVLKGKALSASGHFWLRKGLVVFQFAGSVVLIAGTLVVFSQLSYMRTLNLGLDLEQVVAIRAPRVLPDDADRATMMATFKQEVSQLAGVERTALSSTLPGQGFNWNGAALRKLTDDPSAAISGVATYIDSTFASLYGLELVAGRSFHQVAATEDTVGANWKIILNETAAKSLGYKTSSESVDQLVMVGDFQAVVIGVYKDFKWSSAHEAQQSIIFGRTTSGNQVSVRLATTDFGDVIGRLEEKYHTLFPGNLFQYSFVDEAYDLQYKNDQRFARLFSLFAGMSIFIACLGLFGLVAFTAQQRTKEIGMRKVLGASVAGIVALLGKDFLILVLIGFALAIPVTVYVMDQWLENFAYRTDISFGTFALAGSMAILIALATVSWQSIRAAIANPVNSLRSE